MSLKYTLIMFDFDGTLADSFSWLSGVMLKISDKYHFKQLDLQQLEILRNTDGREIMARLGVPFWKIPQMVSYARQLAAADAHQIPLFSGISAQLKGLAEQGATLAVVSSNTLETVKRVLGDQNTALISFFECGVSLSGKETRIARVLKHSRLPAAQAILIGDEIRDIEAAHKAGVASGAVSWGYNRPEVLAALHPTETFGSPEDLLNKMSASSA